MPTMILTISERPGVGVMMEAQGDFEPGSGYLCEELMMLAVEAVNKALAERNDMSSPQVVAGDKDVVRRVFGEEAAKELDPSEPTPPPQKIEPGTILRLPGS